MADIVEDLSDLLSDDQIIENAKSALEYPSDFGYFGSDETLWKTSAPTITKNRDSSNLENAAFDIAWEDLCGQFPDLAPENNEQTTDQRPGQLYIFGCSHWAVGWLEQIVVPVLKEPGEVTLANIHPAFVKALELGVEFPHLEEADTRADDMNWEAVEKDISGWQTYLAERGDPFIKAFAASEMIAWLSEFTREDEYESSNYMPGDEDSIPYSWFTDASRENGGPQRRRIFGVRELHAALCWDEAHQEVTGQEELPNG